MFSYEVKFEERTAEDGKKYKLFTIFKKFAFSDVVRNVCFHTSEDIKPEEIQLHLQCSLNRLEKF